ncbi:MAG: protein kinase [Acidobacteria bacterium]|nr:protein kinase [Acidobacteriota bacterium]
MSDSPNKFGRYETRRTLGKGAMGVVYGGVDPVIGRDVAIKVVRGDTGADIDTTGERFEREFKAAGRLSHPNIVPIYDVGREGDSWYIAMELVDGTSLDEIMTQGGDLSPERSLNLLQGIAAGLDHSHKHGVIHRDVKPANILVTTDGIPKVTDFGVAKPDDGTMTAAGAILGTPAYMSPEQAKGQKLTGASDQFSLAVMAYQLLTGQRPFHADTATAFLYQIVHEEPTRPSELGVPFPPSMDDVLLKGLSKDPAARYGSCREFVNALSSNWVGGDETLPMSAISGERAPLDRSLDAQPMTMPESDAGGKPIAIIAVVLLVMAAGGMWAVSQLGGSDPAPAESTPAESSNPATPTPPSVEPVEEAEPTSSGVGADGRGGGTNDVDDALAAAGAAAATVDEATLTAGEGTPDSDNLESSSETTTESTENLAPAADPEAAAAAAAPTQSLSVTSRPDGARVLLDGEAIDGVTPLDIEVTGGERHTLELELEGHQDLSWAFATDDLNEAQLADGLHFPLVPDVPPGALAITTSHAVRLEMRSAEGRTQRITIDADDTIEVFPGTWTVQMVAEDVFLDQTTTIEVRSEENASVAVPAIVELQIAAAPSNCRVSVNGRFIDVTPIRIPIVVGSHEFTFEWPGLDQSITRTERIAQAGQRIFATPPEEQE